MAITKQVVSYYKPFLAKQNGKLTTRERLFGAPRCILIKTTLVKSLEYHLVVISSYGQ